MRDEAAAAAHPRGDGQRRPRAGDAEDAHGLGPRQPERAAAGPHRRRSAASAWSPCMAAPASNSTPAPPTGTSSRQVKQAVDIPVIANGDILTEDDAAEALRRSGADGRDDRPRLLRPALVPRPGRRTSCAPASACREPPLAAAERRRAQRTTARCSTISATRRRACGSRASTSPGTRAACPARPSSAPR